MFIQRLLPTLLASFIVIPVFADDADDIANLISQGDNRAAVEHADAALTRKPKDARLRFLRASALAGLGRTAEAIQVYAGLTTDYPSMPEPYNNLAVLYAQQGQLDRARQVLQQAMRTNPAYATAHANLADVYSQLAAQAYDRALKNDKGAATAHPSAPKLAMVGDLYSRNVGTLLAAGTNASTTALPKPAVNAGIVATAAKINPTPAKVAQSAPTKAMTVVQAPSANQIAEAKPAITTQSESRPTEAKTGAATPASMVLQSKPAQPATVKSLEANNKSDEEQIAKTIHAWAEAWESKKVGAYLAFYGASFKPAGLPRNEWEKQRRERIEGARKILVSVSGIKIKLDGDMATAHFVQKYRSDKLDTSTGKTLILKRASGRWYIHEERVK